jgi:hypothetical protein
MTSYLVLTEESMVAWRKHTKSVEEMCARKGINFEHYMNGFIDEDGNELE